MMKHFLLLFFLCYCYFTSVGQGFIGKVDSVLQKRYLRIKYDTSYISRPEQRFMVMLSPMTSQIGLNLSGDSAVMDLNSKINSTFKLNFAYRGLVLGYSFKPGKVLNEFTLRYYGKKIGFEFDICQSDNFSGTLTVGENKSNEIKIGRGLLDMAVVELSAYYVKNNKKFSYPAAFTKSYFQKKSCGSMLFGAAMVASYSNLSHQEDSLSLSNASIGLGVGYGYNFVLKEKFMIHISTIPSFIVMQKNLITHIDSEEKIPYSFSNFSISGRFSMSYNLKKFFFGADCIFYSTIVGSQRILQAKYNRSLARFFAGVRF